MIAKILMPWLFVSRKLGWTPFAKVRREGYVLRARRKIRRPSEGRLADIDFSSKS